MTSLPFSMPAHRSLEPYDSTLHTWLVIASRWCSVKATFHSWLSWSYSQTLKGHEREHLGTFWEQNLAWQKAPA